MICVSGGTKKQHYIPQMILRRFVASSPCRLRGVWRYDSLRNESRCVDYKGECKRKYLYEYRDDNGDIDDGTKNTIEQLLSSLESKWCVVLDRVERREMLSEKDATLLYVFLTFQLLRLPSIMDMAASLIQERILSVTGKHVEDYIAKNYALLFSFGFVDNQSGVFLDEVINMLGDFDLFIGYVSCKHDEFLLDGDMPIASMPYSILRSVCGDISVDVCSGMCDCLFFPFSKHYCLFLVRAKSINVSSVLYKSINHDMLCMLNNLVYNRAGVIYSSHPIKDLKGVCLD